MKGKKQETESAANPRGQKERRLSVAAILREAYRLHTRDRETKIAVRACLKRCN